MAEHVLHHGQAKDISANAIPPENTSARYANTNVSKVKNETIRDYKQIIFLSSNRSMKQLMDWLSNPY